ncbi:MAG TPA: VOC family protein [Bacteroides reticulotermitis]|nr:VOC family protein [Bacteroides reticulotermitis]
MKYQSLVPNLGVKSVNETVKFYTEVLGFQQIACVPEHGELVFAIIRAGDVNLMFQQLDSLQEEYPDLKNKNGQAGLTFYIKMQDKKALYERVKDAAFLVKAMHTTPYGAEEFAICDNNGFILTITEDEDRNEQIRNYDNFFLPVDDYEGSKRFYSDVLGLTLKFEFAAQGMVAFSVGDEEPAIILKDKNKFPTAQPTLWLEVADVRMLYSEMKNKGVEFLSEPFKIRTGWAVEFSDPSGNTLGFTDYIQ